MIGLEVDGVPLLGPTVSLAQTMPRNGFLVLLYPMALDTRLRYQGR